MRSERKSVPSTCWASGHSVFSAIQHNRRGIFFTIKFYSLAIKSSPGLRLLLPSKLTVQKNACHKDEDSVML